MVAFLVFVAFVLWLGFLYGTTTGRAMRADVAEHERERKTPPDTPEGAPRGR